MCSLTLEQTHSQNQVLSNRSMTSVVGDYSSSYDKSIQLVTHLRKQKHSSVKIIGGLQGHKLSFKVVNRRAAAGPSSSDEDTAIVEKKKHKNCDNDFAGRNDECGCKGSAISDRDQQCNQSCNATFGSSSNSSFGTTTSSKHVMSRNKRKVSFSYITIREYNMTIGDNPSCSRGAPISLNWTYNSDHKVCTIDSYEKSREYNPPRKRAEMLIPMTIRHSKLKEEWNVSTSEILRIIQENKIIQAQRHKSTMQKDSRIKAEAMLENAKNSMRRLVPM